MKFAEYYKLTIHDVFPATETMLLAFIAYLHSTTRPLAYKTVKAYLSHVKRLAILLGTDDTVFSASRIQVALRGYRLLHGDAPVKRRRIPITIDILNKFISLLDPTIPNQRVIGAMLCVGVYGLFRSGELACKTSTPTVSVLSRADVSWKSDCCTITLRASKTDPFRNGADIILYKNSSPTCPYRWLREHFDNAPRQFTFAPLFQSTTGSPISYDQLNSSIKLLAAKAGLDPTLFAGHSLRIGGATSLAQLGYPAHFIKELGRWSSLSYQVYTRLTNPIRKAISNDLAKVRFPQGAKDYFGGMHPKDAYGLQADDIGVLFGRIRKH